MPRNRTKYQAKREHELTAGELLDVCGPSDTALQRTTRIGPTANEKKQRRREMELANRARRIGRIVRANRQMIQPPAPAWQLAPIPSSATRPKRGAAVLGEV